MEVILKWLDSLLKPIQITIFFFVFSLVVILLKFFPEKILIKLDLLNFLQKYTFIAVLVFIGTLSLLIVFFFNVINEKIKEKKVIKALQKKQKELFNDPEARRFLNSVYESSPYSVTLPIRNKKVMELRQFKLIHQTAKEVLMTATEVNNPYMPFILTQSAENLFKKILKEESNR